MAEARQDRAPARPHGIVGNLLALPLRLFGVLCGSLLLSILIECVCMHFLWPQERWHHAEEMLDYELHQLSSDFRESLLVKSPTQAARRAVEWTYDHLFLKSGLLGDVRELYGRSEAQAARRSGLAPLLGMTFTSIEDYTRAAGYTLLTFIVRLIVLVLTLPLFFLAWFVGLIDGLARRDIRRFGAGRESGYVYHRARALLPALIILPWVAYLAMPVSVEPLSILLPSAVLLSITVNLTAASFKKYL